MKHISYKYSYRVQSMIRIVAVINDNNKDRSLNSKVDMCCVCMEGIRSIHRV